MEETVHNELRSLSHIIYRFIENLPNKKKIESMTGTNGCIIGYLAENFTLKYAVGLCVMLAGNMITTFLLGLVVRYALPELAQRAAELFAKKLSQSFPQTLIRAAFCGVLMYLAVQIFREKKTPIGILFCIPVFILSGFEHSIADMFYFGASGIFKAEPILFELAAVLGNTLGSLLLPILSKVSNANAKKTD